MVHWCLGRSEIVVSKKLIYVSLDIEADGPAPIVNSMLSLGAVALDRTKGKGKDAIVGTWTANFDLLPGAKQDPDTMKWWETQPEAWAACREKPQDPKKAMRSLDDWVRGFGGKPVAVGFPAGFDFTFVYVYFHLLLGECPFGFAAIDFKSLAACHLNIPYHESRKRNFPKRWFDGSLPHTHKAIDDAMEQGVMLVNALDDIDAAHAEAKRHAT